MGDKKILEAHYLHRINPAAKGHVILDWESEDAHLGRFAIVTEKLDLTGMSILDVGCGVGDFFGFLNQSVQDFSYTGIDILPEMSNEAQRRYPGGTFLSGDMVYNPIFRENAYDLIYSSGIFNLNMGTNEQFLKDALKVFFSVAKQWVVFNMLDPDHPVQSTTYFYQDPVRTEAMVRRYTDHVQIERDYVPMDYTIFARKQAAP